MGDRNAADAMMPLRPPKGGAAESKAIRGGSRKATAGGDRMIGHDDTGGHGLGPETGKINRRRRGQTGLPRQAAARHSAVWEI